METYFITGNKNKLKEVQSIIPDIKQLDFDLPEIQDIDASNIIKTKLSEAFTHKEGFFIVEDTSLYLDCLNGLPGPLIKWFIKTIGNEGIYNIAQKFNNFSAQAKTIIGYAKNNSDIKFFEGVINGIIVKPVGEHGFGWDAIFQPSNASKSFAEMSPKEKNVISMRRIAANKLKKHLEQQ